MLLKKYRLTKKKDFDEVFKKGRSFYNEYLGIKFLKNSLTNPRFGIIINLKVSKLSVERNKIRRRLREIIKKRITEIKNYDIILLVMPKLKNKKMTEMEKIVDNSFKKLRLY